MAADSGDEEPPPAADRGGVARSSSFLKGCPAAHRISVASRAAGLFVLPAAARGDQPAGDAAVGIGAGAGLRRGTRAVHVCLSEVPRRANKCKHQPGRRCRSKKAPSVPACWPRSRSTSTPGTCRCIASRNSYWDRYGSGSRGSLLCRLVRGTAEALRPLALRLLELILSGFVIQGDETTVRYLDRSSDKALLGYFWGFAGDGEHRYVAFDFHTSRGRAGPSADPGELPRLSAERRLLGLHIAGEGCAARLTHVGCWAHARRKFEEALYTTSHPLAA